jgi:H+/Cl- antiporter ClcA
MLDIKRRGFITLVGAAAAARRVGILMNAAAEDSEGQSYVAAFQQGMQELGWSVSIGNCFGRIAAVLRPPMGMDAGREGPVGRKRT